MRRAGDSPAPSCRQRCGDLRDWNAAARKFEHPGSAPSVPLQARRQSRRGRSPRQPPLRTELRVRWPSSTVDLPRRRSRPAGHDCAACNPSRLTTQRGDPSSGATSMFCAQQGVEGRPAKERGGIPDDVLTSPPIPACARQVDGLDLVDPDGASSRSARRGRRRSGRRLWRDRDRP